MDVIHMPINARDWFSIGKANVCGNVPAPVAADLQWAVVSAAGSCAVDSARAATT